MPVLLDSFVIAIDVCVDSNEHIWGVCLEAAAHARHGDLIGLRGPYSRAIGYTTSSSLAATHNHNIYTKDETTPSNLFRCQKEERPSSYFLEIDFRSRPAPCFMFNTLELGK